MELVSNTATDIGAEGPRRQEGAIWRSFSRKRGVFCVSFAGMHEEKHFPSIASMLV